MLDEALAAERVVLSVMGPHAGEGADAIFARKADDVARHGRTFWLCRSPAARPDRAQLFAPDFVVFLASATRNGARSTSVSERATEMSLDRQIWSPIPDGISPVTGNLIRGAYAFVISRFEMQGRSTLDLWSYAAPNGAPIAFRLGASTLFAMRGDMSLHPARPKSRYREVLAVARLDAPFVVWVR